MLYSIIIPHRNILDLLSRCLDSIPCRDDTEVIVVDDNSTDSDHLLNYFSNLNRKDVTFIRTTEGRGAGYARNVGLSYATGVWVIFADADDFFADDFGAILNEYKYSDKDILYFRKGAVLSENVRVKSNRDLWLDKLFDAYFKDGDDLQIRCFQWAPWGKIIKRSLIEDNDIRFDEIPFSNDVIFGVSAGLAAKKVHIIDRVMYYVTERRGSLTYSFGSKDGELDIRCRVAFRAQQLYNRHKVDIENIQIPYLLTLMLRYDRKLFWHFFSRLPEIRLPQWKVAYQIMIRVLLMIRNKIASVFFRWAVTLNLRPRVDAGVE